MPQPGFPDDGILWHDLNDETLRIINERKNPVLPFIRNSEPLVWPFSA